MEQEGNGGRSVMMVDQNACDECYCLFLFFYFSSTREIMISHRRLLVTSHTPNTHTYTP